MNTQGLPIVEPWRAWRFGIIAMALFLAAASVFSWFYLPNMTWQRIAADTVVLLVFFASAWFPAPLVFATILLVVGAGHLPSPWLLGLSVYVNYPLLARLSATRHWIFAFLGVFFLVATSFLHPTATGLPYFVLLLQALLALAFGLVIGYYQRALRQEYALRQQAQQDVQAQMETLRGQLAKDLHDNLGARMTHIAVANQRLAAATSPGQGKNPSAELTALSENTSAAMQDLRGLIARLAAGEVSSASGNNTVQDRVSQENLVTEDKASVSLSGSFFGRSRAGGFFRRGRDLGDKPGPAQTYRAEKNPEEKAEAREVPRHPENLTELVTYLENSARTAGLDFTITLDRERFAQAEAPTRALLVDLLAEATLNAVKYADTTAPAALYLDFSQGGVELVATNAIEANKLAPAFSGGWGLVNLARRVKEAGGSFEYGQNAQRWLLRVTLPARPPAQPAARIPSV